MANTLQEGQVLIPMARLGYPKLFKAESVKKDPASKARFGCQIYLPKSDRTTAKAVQAEIDRLVKEKLKGVKPKGADICVSDGDDGGDENTKGHWIISANRAEKQGRPQVIDRNRTPLTPDDNRPYAGCYCAFLISFFVPKDWKKICASLEVVQFAKDGEPFGAGRVDVDAVMPNLDDDDGGGMLGGDDDDI